MSPTYQSPGVYMEEVDRGTKPIEAVGTAVAAFVGYTEFASSLTLEQQLKKSRDAKLIGERENRLFSSDQDLIGKPTAVTNWSQYEQKFGKFFEGAYLPDAVYGYFANGGGRCYIVSLKTLGTEDGAAAVSAGSAAGKLTIYAAEDATVPLLEISPKAGLATSTPVEVQIKPDSNPEGTFTLVVTVDGKEAETYPNLTTDKGERGVEKMVATSTTVSVKVVSKAKMLPAVGSYALPSAATSGKTASKTVTLQDYRGSLAERKGVEGLEQYDDITMICVPDLMANYQKNEAHQKFVQGVQQTIIDYCEKIKYCFAILDAPPGMMPEEIFKWRETVGYDSTRAGLYYPWVEVPNQISSNGKSVSRLIPPSGHVAGIYARNDNERGVHKAPANEVVRAAIGLEVQVTKGEQDRLNPVGINCIRAFPGRGIRVWGARTLSSNASWRYINVRRLFSMIEDSIERGTQWVVFEPNDPNLWARVRRDVTSFLKVVWRSGALFGDTPEQAFYVKCDAETNPPEIRDLGQLVIEIGLAPVKPAEFVIFRVSQWAGPDAGE